MSNAPLSEIGLAMDQSNALRTALEFGGYLADAVEQLQLAQRKHTAIREAENADANRLAAAADLVAEHEYAVERAIGAFRRAVANAQGKDFAVGDPVLFLGRETRIAAIETKYILPGGTIAPLQFLDKRVAG